MKRRQSIKSVERSVAFQASLKLGEEWELEPRESPDFIVTAANARFGLEVTRCQIGRRGRKGSKMRQAESARQAWLDGIRSDYESQGGASLNLKYWGAITSKARETLLGTLLANDFSGPVRRIRMRPEGDGASILAFETPNAHWEMPEDRAGEASLDSSIFQRVIDEKAEKLPVYREVCGDIRLLVVADQIYNSGKLLLEPGVRPDLKGFSTVYFFAYPRTMTSFYAAAAG